MFLYLIQDQMLKFGHFRGFFFPAKIVCDKQAVAACCKLIALISESN